MMNDKFLQPDRLWTFEGEVTGAPQHPLVCGFTLVEEQSS